MEGEESDWLQSCPVDDCVHVVFCSCCYEVWLTSSLKDNLVDLWVFFAVWVEWIDIGPVGAAWGCYVPNLLQGVLPPLYDGSCTSVRFDDLKSVGREEDMLGVRDLTYRENLMIFFNPKFLPAVNNQAFIFKFAFLRSFDTFHIKYLHAQILVSNRND